MPSESSGESADLKMMLMNDLPHPTAREQQAIRAAAAWFKKTAIYGQRYGVPRMDAGLRLRRAQANLGTLLPDRYGHSDFWRRR